MYIWPEQFEEGKSLDGYTERELIAAALCAWALCMWGERPPKTFGDVLIAIGERTGCPSMSADGLMEFSKRYIDADVMGLAVPKADHHDPQGADH